MVFATVVALGVVVGALVVVVVGALVVVVVVVGFGVVVVVLGHSLQTLLAALPDLAVFPATFLLNFSLAVFSRPGT